MSANDHPDRPRERVFNAPPMALLIAVSMPLLFMVQLGLPDGGLGMAFAPINLQQGRYGGLLTSMLLHGGWTHVIMNAVAALAFGAPVARLLDVRWGPTLFLLFYVGCGVLAALGYGLIHWGGTQPMVGASGAVFGLIGAATRLMGGHGQVLALSDGRVIKAAIAWMAVNAVVGLIGYVPGAAGAGIAWEAHAVGFVVGILVVGPLARLARAG